MFTATPQRVINSTGQERYSIPFFFGTNYDAVIESLETCCGPERPSRYPPVQAGHYLASRLHEVYGSQGPGEPDEPAEPAGPNEQAPKS